MNLEVDGDGFLINRDVWSESVMTELALSDGVTLTPQMIEMILAVRDTYASEGIVPPLRVFSKSQGGDRKGSFLNEIFNAAPMKKIAKWGGLPKPTGCV